jgi:ASC-1-like (ASCH) protein
VVRPIERSPEGEHELSSTGTGARPPEVSQAGRRGRGDGAGPRPGRRAEGSGANDRLRLGLIGAGGRGTEILRAALRCPNTEAVAAADVYTHRLDAIKRVAPDIKTYTDFRQLLDDESIDAVFIATPQHQHALNFVPAIQAGKDG